MLNIKRSGITAEELGIPNLELGSLKLMTAKTAEALYRKYFWKPAYDQIVNQTAATKIFDFAINAGHGNAHETAQKAVNSLGQSVTVDGALGPKSVAAINACGAGFVKAMASEMAAYYERRIVARPANAKFRNNWLKRAAWGL
jgi:lysozyme family protein